MTAPVEIPGLGRLELEHLVLDMNGTLTNRGRVIEGVAERLVRVRARMDILLVSADTFGTLDAVAAELQLSVRRAASGEDKLALLRQLNAEQCAVIGNGANDASILEAAALGIAIIGPEGASSAALRAADVVCLSVLDALDLLLDERALQATLRR
jgi:P-type E1-E2 ATPase